MVVKGVDISVKRGEIVGLLGPNGAGKTTSFYMITGMINPNEGSHITRAISATLKIGKFIEKI